MKIRQKARHIIQLVSAAFFNGYIKGFFKGSIFTGNSKILCVPVLNCYSCPGALGACPIGSIQAVLGSTKFNFSFYVLGIVMLFGIVFGRIMCGFLCPFGLIQDLLYKIPLKKSAVPQKADKAFRKLKYAVLLIMVIILPIIAVNKYGVGSPYFCKWICPAGTLEGGIPLLFLNESLRKSIGFIFRWKAAVLIIIVILSVFIYRPFCRYICPLGAIYGLYNRVSFFGMNLDKEKCSSCKACEKACPMRVNLTEKINTAECIRCGKCSEVCHKGAINLGIRNLKNHREVKHS